MSVKFFKPEDFIQPEFITGSFVTMDMAAVYANAKLEREGKVVYKNGASAWTPDPDKYFEGTLCKPDHRALLINIEPIEPCKHPKEKISRHVDYNKGNSSYRESWTCEACGNLVKPSAFEVADE